MASSRVGEAARPAPAVPRAGERLLVAAPVLLLAAVLAAVPWLTDEFRAYQLGLYLLYGLVAQGIALTWGRAGFLSLGQALFFGLGAYLSGFILKASEQAAAWLALLPLAALAPALLAYVIGRLVFARRHESGPFFSLITLALVMLGFQLANQWSGITGGFNGLGGIPDLPGLGGRPRQPVWRAARRGRHRAAVVRAARALCLLGGAGRAGVHRGGAALAGRRARRPARAGDLAVAAAFAPGGR